MPVLFNHSTKQFIDIELRSRPDVEENFSYYEQFYFNRTSLYSEMKDAEKKDFRVLVKNAYYDWLGLNDQMIEDNPAILEAITVWIKKSNILGFFENICHGIRDAYNIKDLNGDYVKDDTGTIQKNKPLNEINAIDGKNKKFVKERYERECDAIIAMIQDFAKTYSKQAEANIPPAARLRYLNS